eukprot:m.459942 g.459942  ORF g.459942 m.459942 type:complete len:329 (+) comp21874_c0_seq1:115-1101(+)
MSKPAFSYAKIANVKNSSQRTVTQRCVHHDAPVGERTTTSHRPRAQHADRHRTEPNPSQDKWGPLPTARGRGQQAASAGANPQHATTWSAIATPPCAQRRRSSKPEPHKEATAPKSRRHVHAESVSVASLNSGGADNLNSPTASELTLGEAPDGLFYFPNVWGPESEAELIRALEKEDGWVKAGHSTRRVLQFDWEYTYGRHASLKAARPSPSFMQKVVDAVRELPGMDKFTPEQVIVNRYLPGEGIPAHIDNRIFGDQIVCVSLGAECIMRFEHKDTHNVYNQKVEGGSVYGFGGSARWDWFHEMPAQSRRKQRGIRYSITFRTLNQ